MRHVADPRQEVQPHMPRRAQRLLPGQDPVGQSPDNAGGQLQPPDRGAEIEALRVITATGSLPSAISPGIA